MKLLLTLLERNKTPPKVVKIQIQDPSIMDAIEKKDKGEFLGSGVESCVIQHKSGKVVKETTIWNQKELPLEHFSAFHFIELIKKHQDNPFFPKIYSVKYYSSKNLHGIPTYIILLTMEELGELDDYSDEEQHKMFATAGIPKRIANQYLKFPDEYIITNKGIDSVIQKRKNKQMANAFRLLRPYLKTFTSDLLKFNWMVRKSPNGPELVIIDPFQSNSLC